MRVKKTLETKLVTYLTYIFKKTSVDNEFIDSLAPSIKKSYLTHNIRAKFDFLVFEQLLNMSPHTNRTKFEDSLIDLIKEETFPERYKLIMPPSKFKLYYINQGICKRIAALGVAKYSDTFVVLIFKLRETSISVITPSSQVIALQNLHMKVLPSSWLNQLADKLFLISWNKEIFTSWKYVWSYEVIVLFDERRESSL